MILTFLLVFLLQSGTAQDQPPAGSGQMEGSVPGTENFRWIDFRDPKDAPTVGWVTNQLKAEKWTAIREIGVQWDSALVITTLRKDPQGVPAADVTTLWSVSLAKHEAQPLLHVANARVLNWTTFGGASQHTPELGLVFQDCFSCEAPSTFFTALYYNGAEHGWRARWVRGDQAAALSSSAKVEGVTQTQVYGLLTEPLGREILATWSHLDYGGAKPAEDFVFEYSVDPSSGLDQTQALSGKHGDEMKQRLCKADPGQADPEMAELARGQDSELCRAGGEVKAKVRVRRRGVTGPPANNQGRSLPPGARK